MSSTQNDVADNPQAVADSELWDVLVVGAGPAGCLAARQLGLRGHRVLLIEKARFPRHKVCGGCVNAAALSVLTSCGLQNLPVLQQAPSLRTMRWRRGTQEVVLSLPAGVSVARSRFDQELADAARVAGVTFLTDTVARHTEVAEDHRHRIVECFQGRQRRVFRARLVIQASGLRSFWRQSVEQRRSQRSPHARIGLGAVFPDGPEYFRRGVIYMHHDPAGYVGVVRLADGSLDVAAAVTDEAVRRVPLPGQLIADIFARARLPVPDQWAAAAWKGTPRLTQRPPRLGDERMLLVGDAAGYVEPFTGEGIGWALLSGCLVAEIADRAVENWHSRLISSWERVHAHHIGRRQRVCRLLARTLASGRCVDGMMRGLTLLPQLAQPVVRALNQPFASRATTGSPIFE